MCYEYDAYFYIGLSGVGMMFSSMASEMTLAGFNLLRVALFATRIFV